MLVVETPSRESLVRRQEDEAAYYWSGCVEALLRKHGIVSFSSPEEAIAHTTFTITTRGCDSDRDGVGCWEGPVTETTLRTLGLGATPLRAEAVTLSTPTGSELGSLGYPRFKVRRIPARRSSEVSHPYEFSSPDAKFNNVTIRLQDLRAGEPWRPVLVGRTDSGDNFVAAVSDGTRLVLGVPLFDLLGSTHSFPPTDVGYYSMTTGARTSSLEDWLLEEIWTHACRSGALMVRAGSWPSGTRAALTVRHDYDRPMKPKTARALLDFYDGTNIRSSWGFLLRTFDPKLSRSLVENGHEVALHTEANERAGFLREVNELEKQSGIRPAGYTAHGGGGSQGFLGSNQYEWAEEAGMLYGEILGRSNRLPHLVNRIVEGVPRATPLVLQVTHDSLDSSTKPDGHRLDPLLQRLPQALDSGRHVVVMNHPDVHIKELMALLEELDLAEVWKETLAGVAAWARAAKLLARMATVDDVPKLRFPEPLSQATDYEVHIDGWSHRATAPPGASDLALPVELGSANAAG